MLIRAAADALGLAFVPLIEERFDLVVFREALDDPRIQALLEVLRGPTFRQRMEALGGYDSRETGQLRCLPAGSWQWEPAPVRS
jgi:putative molybdopterin biosynthesis protein